MVAKEFIKELKARGVELEYQKKIDLMGEYWNIYAYGWSKEVEAIINDIYCSNSWEEPVFIRYAGGWGFIDCGKPYITVEFGS